MISRINTYIDRFGSNEIIEKYFQRGLQTIGVRIAKHDGKIYHKSWEINEFNHKKVIKQAYRDGEAIKNSRSVLDYYA